MSWDSLAYDSVQTLGVNRLLVLEDAEIDNIFLGTYGDGVFRYGNVATAVDDATDCIIPGAFALKQNYPNPFNPQTTICYQLPDAGHVKLQIFDLTGRLVETLVDENQPTGEYSKIWNAEVVSSGIYFYRLETKDFTSVKKCVKMK